MMGNQPTSPAQIREEFERLVIGDVYGPAFGPSEVLSGRLKVRDRYLVGMLAPRDVRVIPSLFDEPGTAAGEGDDGGGIDRTATQGIFPSSLGLSFAVDGNVTELSLRASWVTTAKKSAKSASLR
jgi:hypothetical protein